MKKLITMVLVASMVLSMTACGNKSDVQTTDSQASPQAVPQQSETSSDNNVSTSSAAVESKEESKPVEDVATDTHDTLAAQAAFEGELLNAMGLEKQDGYGWYYAVFTTDKNNLQVRRKFIAEFSPFAASQDGFKTGDIVKFSIECNEETGETVDGILYIVCCVDVPSRFDVVYYIPTDDEEKVRNAIAFHELESDYSKMGTFELLGHIDGVFSESGIALELAGEPYFTDGNELHTKLSEDITVVTKPVYTQNKDAVIDAYNFD